MERSATAGLWILRTDAGKDIDSEGQSCLDEEKGLVMMRMKGLLVLSLFAALVLNGNYIMYCLLNEDKNTSVQMANGRRFRVKGDCTERINKAIIEKKPVILERCED